MTDLRVLASKHGGKSVTAATVLMLVLQNAGLLGTVRGGNGHVESSEVTTQIIRHVEQTKGLRAKLEEMVEAQKATRETTRLGLQLVCLQLAKVPDNCLRIQ